MNYPYLIDLPDNELVRTRETYLKIYDQNNLFISSNSIGKLTGEKRMPVVPIIYNNFDEFQLEYLPKYFIQYTKRNCPNRYTFEIKILKAKNIEIIHNNNFKFTMEDIFNRPFDNQNILIGSSLPPDSNLDMVLNDQSISNLHCGILLEEYLQKYFLTKQFVLFLKYLSKKKVSLAFNLLEKIYRFTLLKTPEIFIRDMSQKKDEFFTMLKVPNYIDNYFVIDERLNLLEKNNRFQLDKYKFIVENLNFKFQDYFRTKQMIQDSSRRINIKLQNQPEQIQLAYCFFFKIIDDNSIVYGLNNEQNKLIEDIKKKKMTLEKFKNEKHLFFQLFSSVIEKQVLHIKISEGKNIILLESLIGIVLLENQIIVRYFEQIGWIISDQQSNKLWKYLPKEQKCLLKHGDIIKLGTYELQYLIKEEKSKLFQNTKKGTKINYWQSNFIIAKSLLN